MGAFEHELVLVRALAYRDAGLWALARGPEGPTTVLITPLDDPRDLHGHWAATATTGLIATPTALPSSEGSPWRVSVAPAPEGPVLAEALAGLRDGRPTGPVFEAVARLVVPLVRACAGLHVQDAVLGLSDPELVVLTETGVRLLAAPLKPDAPHRRLVPGFSSPEFAGHCGGALDARSDVFFCGMALYYALTRVRPLAESAAYENGLPPPHVFRDDLPPELCAVARRATSSLPLRRYGDATGMLGALERAVDTARARASADVSQRLSIDIGHERHIGVLKGQYAPINQDDLFLGYHGPTGIGLFVVADGVSISEHGTGDMASGCVREAATALWHAILEGRPGDVPVDDETIDGLDEVAPALPDGEGRRRGMLKQMVQQANGLIADLVHEEKPRFIGPPEGIMASTTVAALVEHGHVTLMSIGDSRAYLVRDGHIASLMVDHDLSTQLIRMGRPPSLARAVPSAAALIRCVGEFEKDADDRLVPVELNPDFRRFNVLPGDTIVLCSDGIPDYGGFDEEDAEDRIREIVETADGARWAAFELMVLANRGGGGDNISCIVLRFGAPYQEDP